MQTKYLYFIHIPKTAGTFADKLLVPEFGDRYIREGHTVPNCCLQPWTERYGPSHYTSVSRNECYTFTIIRNPFDLLVSMYRFGFPFWSPQYALKGFSVNWPFKSFREFIYKIAKWDDYPWIFPPQKKSLFFQLFSDDGQFLPDLVIRQEEIEIGLQKLLNNFDSKAEIPIQKINVTRTTSYKDYYDIELKEIVEEKFQYDLKAFGYNFTNFNPDHPIDKEHLSYNHREGQYNLSSKVDWDHTVDGKPSGQFADVDFHKFDKNFLELFSGKEISSHLLKRITKRVFGVKPNV